MCMLPRAVVHEALLKEVDAKDIRWGVRATGVRDGDESEGCVVQYEDGTEETADLVIGADGVRSVVKKVFVQWEL